MTTIAAARRAPTAPPQWSRTDTRRLSRLLGVVAALHLLGWVGLAVITSSITTSTVLSAGLAVTAYSLGVRQAFDADHLAVIDGATRALSDHGRRPLSVGLWFSLGHSTVVFVMATLAALGAHLATGLLDENGTARSLLATLGTGVAGTFLWAIGIVNLIALIRLLRQQRRPWTAAAAGVTPTPGGVMSRLLRGVLPQVARPRQVYPIGVLMGLGFDTASEVAPLVLAATAAATLPWYALLLLLVLFTAGMTLSDTLDGALLTVAYRWATEHPHRTATYTITVTVTVTAVSVADALGIGIQLLHLATTELALHDPVTRWLTDLTPAALTAAVIAVVATAWTVVTVASRRSVQHRRRPNREVCAATPTGI